MFYQKSSSDYFTGFSGLNLIRWFYGIWTKFNFGKLKSLKTKSNLTSVYTVLPGTCTRSSCSLWKSDFFSYLKTQKKSFIVQSRLDGQKNVEFDLSGDNLSNFLHNDGNHCISNSHGLLSGFLNVWNILLLYTVALISWIFWKFKRAHWLADTRKVSQPRGVTFVYLRSSEASSLGPDCYPKLSSGAR